MGMKNLFQQIGEIAKVPSVQRARVTSVDKNGITVSTTVGTAKNLSFTIVPGDYVTVAPDTEGNLIVLSKVS